MPDRIHPTVGYQGGKRRLVVRLRPYLPADMPGRYIEPFVGMGAVYLDLRLRGFVGRAELADSHPEVRAYWELVHRDPDALVREAEALDAWPRDAEGYYAMKGEPVGGVARVARFLWLTNFAFGNVPPIYVGPAWKGPGTKLTSSEKWGKTFPWDACVARLRAVGRLVSGANTGVHPDGVALLRTAAPEDTVYADPPYAGTSGYSGSDLANYVKATRDTPARRAILSESSDLRVNLPGWSSSEASVTARLSSGQGATGKRREMVYTRGLSIASTPSQESGESA